MKDDQFVKAIVADYTQANLTDIDRALCDYAMKLTKNPAGVSQGDVDHLRSVGLDDRAITDVCQVISYFNYINRIAEGLGVDLEPEMQEN